MENNNNKGDGRMPGQGSGQTLIIILVAALITFVCIFKMGDYLRGMGSTQEVPYSQFVEALEDGLVDKVQVGGSEVSFWTKEGADGYKPNIEYISVRMEGGDQLTRRLVEAGVESRQEASNNSIWLENLISFALMFGCLVLFMNFMMRRMGGGGIMGVGKSTAKMHMQKETGITFVDVAGQDEAKESLVEIVDFLHNPGKYTHIGAKLPKGALLVGPPGTGKTLLAKAVAGEAKVPFFSLSGSDFVEMFVGVGASRVRDLFKQAQDSAPCIIFIDEVDAIGKSRDSRFGGGNDEREQTLNQLLSEMDGFDSSKGLLVLAATNRPEILDPALLRPGRFDRRIIVDKPDLKGRVNTLKVHSKNVALDETVDLEAIALATSGAVGSDLANMIN